jgi:hypothetical protein
MAKIMIKYNVCTNNIIFYTYYIPMYTCVCVYVCVYVTVTGSLDDTVMYMHRDD